MTTVWMRTRWELRSRFASFVVLGVIVGSIGGVVSAAAAGARRTDTAYERFLTTTRALDIIVTPNCPGAVARRHDISRLLVVAATTLVMLSLRLLQLLSRLPARLL